MPSSLQNILTTIGIAAFFVLWFSLLFLALWRGLLKPLLRLLKKLVVLLRNYPSAIPLIATNAVPLAGVLALDWKIFEVLFLYWVELAVYSFFSVLKLKKVLSHTLPENMPHIRVMAFAIRRRRGASKAEVLQDIVPSFKKIFSFFITAALVIIVILSGISSTAQSFGGSKALHFSLAFFPSPFDFLPSALLALVSYSLSHGYSYKRNFLGKEEFRRITLREQLKAPLDRLGTMWVAVFTGSVFTGLFGTPLAALVVLVFLKTAADIYAHIKEHTKLEKRSLSAAPTPIGNASL